MNHNCALMTDEVQALRAIDKRKFDAGYLADPLVARLHTLELVVAEGDFLSLTCWAKSFLEMYPPSWGAMEYARPASARGMLPH